MENPLRIFNSYRQNFNRWVLCLLSLPLACMAQTENPLSTFDNSYTAKLYGFSIDVTSRLTVLGNNHYELYFNADSLVGSVEEVSNVEWDALAKTVIPHHYSYKRSSLGKGKKEELGFNWIEHTVIDLKKNKILPFDGATKIQDSLSYQLQLRQDLIAQKNNLEYAITNGRKFKKYRFEVVGEEILNTPLGDVKTVKVKRSYTNSDTVTYAWFAKDFQYLLVRLQQEENGSAYTIYISKAALNGKAIAHF